MTSPGPLHRRAVLVACLVAASLALALPPRDSLVSAVDAVNMTVADVDRAVDFYSHILHFQKISDIEVTGDRYEHLEGLFGVRMRIVRMRLGNEFIHLTEYLVPKGRPIPVDAHSNDRS